jgi:hypothetical protein
MSKLLYGTHYVSEDEPCLGLYEINMQSPGSKGIHRYQIIYVMRGGKPSEYRKDMGNAKKFKEDQLRLPGGAYDETTDRYYIEHTVGQLREMANQWRKAPTFQGRPLQHVQGKALWQEWINQIESKKGKEKLVCG